MGIETTPTRRPARDYGFEDRGLVGHFRNRPGALETVLTIGGLGSKVSKTAVGIEIESPVWENAGVLMAAEKNEIKAPSKLLFLLEGRALAEMATTLLILPLLKNAPHGDGHPVLVLPGFMAGDLSTRLLRRFLRDLGYSPHRWDLGRNLGVSDELETLMLDRLRELSRLYERKVSLIGWSLGGVYARFLANRSPEHVRSVITLGSPFTGDPKANNSWKLYEWVTGGPIDEIDEARRDDARRTPPVPTTSIYSRGDGIVVWPCSVGEEGPLSENIEVRGSHLGLGFNPMVLHAVADRLALPEGRWRPFERSGFRGVIYGEPEREAAAP